MYQISYTDGRTEQHETYEAALAAVADYEVGHSGDLSDGGDRTLIWADADCAENDDGSRAIADIRRA